MRMLLFPMSSNILMGSSRFLRQSCVEQMIKMSTLSAQDKLDELSQRIMSTSLVSPPKKKKRMKAKMQQTSKQASMKLNTPCIIQCKNPDLNHYQNQSYEKFDVVPLASKGWEHYKSKGDYFIINIHPTGYQAMSRIDLGTFEDTGLSPKLLQIIENHGISTPTEIQKLAIPSLLSGKSSILVAETGCGKTLAYLAPLVQQILALKASPDYKPSLNTPLALVITPSRELVFQIEEVTNWFGELGITCKALSGGNMKKKMYAEKENVDILIASIGALSKLTTVGTYSIREVRHVVLDEADTLLDDSFNEKMVHYLSRMKMTENASIAAEELDQGRNIQLTLVGATIPTSLSEILEEIVDVSTLHRIVTTRAHQLLPHVPQKFLRLGPSQKPGELLRIVKQDVKHDIPVVIFSNQAPTSDWISMFLNEGGVDCVSLNKAMLLKFREAQLAKFQQGVVSVISCTDVASRGIDTTRAQHIINYDVPYYMADYIHRCGRTGRHSPHGLVKGVVTNFVSNNPREIELVQTIEKSVRSLDKTLPNVNANVRKLIHFRYLKKQEDHLKKRAERSEKNKQKKNTSEGVFEEVLED